MRILSITTLGWLFCSFWSLGQSSGDCFTVIPVCADAPVASRVFGSGIQNDFDPTVITESGCLENGSADSNNIENNTAWFVFRAGTSGQLGFDIRALSANDDDEITADYDFALYGPFEQESNSQICRNIGQGDAQPIRCNNIFNPTGFTGMGVNPANGLAGEASSDPNRIPDNTYDDFLDVNEGEIYYLFINNYQPIIDDNAEPFILTFTGSVVEDNEGAALDCSLRNEFLGFDVEACVGEDSSVVLNALNSEVGPNIASVVWEVDFQDDGQIDSALEGETLPELVVESPNSGRYYVTIEASNGEILRDDVLVTFFNPPELNEIIIIDDFQNGDQTDPYNVRVQMATNGRYEYSLNNGDFQQSPIFLNVPPGVNTLTVNDLNGCGQLGPIEFLIVGYPKFFTPDNDGPIENETWNIKGIELLANPVISIYDRYGKLLKQLNGVSSGWNGTFNGRQMPASDYWFHLEYDREAQDVLVARSVRRHFSLLR